MSLPAGNRLGPYEIVALIGAGGMGEVYRARDTKLKRDVALKVLPEAFVSDPERMARFQREAEVLASLNHPNIAHIYGVEDRALVMELVEGTEPKGPLPFDEAWKIASQIAAALDYSHEKGVVHRDLKPANVKVTPDGEVKLLDFGLAKAFRGQSSPANPDNSPTLTLGATQVGVILGTAAYMAPEQARGKNVDKRADIWAFGVVLYELLTGEQLFKSDEVADTLAQVLTRDPDLSHVPARARKLLRRCLDKDPKTRLRDIGEAQNLLEEATGASGLANTDSGGRRKRLWLGSGVVALLIALAWVSFVHFREKPPAHELMRFHIPTPETSTFLYGPVISPDGQRIAFVASDSGGRSVIWVHSLNSLESGPLSGTEGVSDFPLWSPDSRFIAFAVQSKLKKVDVSGGPPQTVCDLPGPSRGASWSREGVILFGAIGHGLMQVSEAGGGASSVTKIDSSQGELAHSSPVFLPDGRHFIYHRNRSAERSGIYLGSLDAKPEQQSTKRLVATTSGAVYAPYAEPGSSTFSRGHILFLRESSLMAQAFDTRRLELSGDAVPIAQAMTSISGPMFSATTGVLAYRTNPLVGNGVITRLTWFDRSGKTLGTVGEAGQYNTVALSPDGTRVAFSRYGRGATGVRGAHSDLWIHEFARNTSNQLTFDPGQDWMAVWSPDGNRIVFASDRDGNFNLYQKDSSGAGNEEPVLRASETQFPYDWSRDGRFLLYATVSNFSLWFLPLTGDGHKPVSYLHTEANNSQGQFSPDGRFVAYISDASGAKDVYVQPFPKASDGKWKIGTGVQPRWRRDGKELFYISTDSKVMAVDVTTKPAFKAGTPKPLFSAPIWGGATPNNVTRYDVTADGKKFLINSLTQETTAAVSTPMTVVLNWEERLKK